MFSFLLCPGLKFHQGTFCFGISGPFDGSGDVGRHGFLQFAGFCIERAEPLHRVGIAWAILQMNNKILDLCIG